MLALAEVNAKVTPMFVAALVVHTRAPTGKFLGPDAGLLLSRPMMFHVIGVTVNAACATAGTNAAAAASASRRSGVAAQDTSAATRAKCERNMTASDAFHALFAADRPEKGRCGATAAGARRSRRG